MLELRSHVRVTTYELWADPPAPLVPRHLRIPIDERTYSDGTVPRPVPPEEIEAAVALTRAEGVGSVAVAFSVPAGFTSDGLPIGIQIVAPPRCDFEALQLAHAYEGVTDFSARRPPL